MRSLHLILCAAAVTACAPAADQPPAMDTTAAVAPPAPAPIALADVAGRWSMQAKAEGSDSVLVTSEMVVTADTAGWVQIFPNRRDPVPVRVIAVAGDSIVTASGPYKSVLRKGVDVSTTSVLRLEGGRLVGTTVARYATTAADSVVRIRTEGTRLP